MLFARTRRGPAGKLPAGPRFYRVTPASGERALSAQRSAGGRLSDPGVGLPVFSGALSALLLGPW